MKPKSADVTQIPTSPVDLQITLGAEENTITWDAPYITGGSILGYNIYRGSAIDSMQLIQSVSNSPLSASDTPPQSGIYYYYITATNSLGEESTVEYCLHLSIRDTHVSRRSTVNFSGRWANYVSLGLTTFKREFPFREYENLSGIQPECINLH